MCPAASSACRAEHRVGLRDLAAEELDRERGSPPRTLARRPAQPECRSRPATVVLRLRDVGHGVLGSVRGERREDSRAKPARGLGRGTTMSSSRPPRVTPIASGLGNLVHLLERSWFAASRQGCASAGRAVIVRVSKIRTLAVVHARSARSSSSAAHSPRSRRSASRRPRAANARRRDRPRRTSSPLAISRSGAIAARARARPAKQQRAEQVRGDVSARAAEPRRAGRTGAPRRSTPLRPAFARVALDAGRVVVERQHRLEPELAAAIASTPEPQPRSRNEPGRLEREHQLQAQPRGGVRAGPERLARVDHEVERASLRRLPRRPDA